MGRTGLDSSVNFCSSSTIMLLVRCCCCIKDNMACSNGESLGAASEALSEVLSTAISPLADVLRFWFVGWPEPEVIGNVEKLGGKSKLVKDSKEVGELKLVLLG